MKHVPLNEYLTSKSNWPKRLLGWEDYRLKRSPEFVSKEYDSDRYAPLMACKDEGIEACKAAEFANLNMSADEPLFFSIGEEVFRSDVRTGRLLWSSIIVSAAQRFAKGTVCELGCGYGYNLSRMGNGAYGGEFSSNAVKLAKHLGQDVCSFDYHRREDYSFIRAGSTILTVHSLEQLPTALPFIENLASVKDRVDRVIHLEPCFLEERTTLLGMIRNRYNELIDHNHDLVRLLQARSDVKIEHFEPEVFGLHPLNSTNLVVWRFL